MLHFRCLGIPVRVEPFFWVTMTLIGALNFGRGLSGGTQILLIALFVLAGFISILVHELGHALTARHFGSRVEIVLQALGGYARYSSAGITRKKSIIITAAGPVLQSVLGALSFLLFLMMLPSEYRSESLDMRQLFTNEPGMMFLLSLTAISWIWAIFNLLPILPMDGGRIVQAALGPQRIRTTLWISIGTSVLLCLWAISARQPFIAIFVAFIGYQSWQALQQTRFR